MAISFTDLVAVGDALLANGGEPSERSAVSRYYYASLHGAEVWLAATPGMPSAGPATGGTHDIVYHKLRNLDRQASADQRLKGRKLAIALLTLKGRRVTADYKLNATHLSSEALQTQADINAFVSQCTTAP